MPSLVSITIDERIAVVKLNRPKMKNALNIEIFERITEIFSNIKLDLVDIVILEGYKNEQTSFFSSGIDLIELSNLQANTPEEIPSILSKMQKSITSIEKLKIPVIAKITGYCFGSALELALACDFIVADTQCKLGMFETKFGIIPDLGGTTRLVHRIGHTNAKKMIYLADYMSADDGYKIGLIDWIYPLDIIDQKTNDIISKIKSNSIIAISKVKFLINKIYNANLDDNLSLEKETQLQLIGNDEVAYRITEYLKSLKKS